MRKCTFKDKSYAIEFIVNYNKDNEPSLLVINIPGKICEINQHSLCGEVMVEYKGIPENAFVGCFILYIFDIKKISLDDYFNMKTGNKEGLKFQQKHLIDYQILVIC